MKDWLGNKIKNRQTVLRILTKPLIESDLKEDCWQILDEYKIIKAKKRLLAISKQGLGGLTWGCVADLLIHDTKPGDDIIFAIKGKSDKKELYYENNRPCLRKRKRTF